VLSLIFSWLIWKETLNFKGYIGLGFIVFGGIYTFFRETKKQVKITIDKPLRR
jgi:drug/metabolite transporter (DMT)-like permease